jgi:hypothetical protein
MRFGFNGLKVVLTAFLHVCMILPSDIVRSAFSTSLACNCYSHNGNHYLKTHVEIFRCGFQTLLQVQMALYSKIIGLDSSKPSEVGDEVSVKNAARSYIDFVTAPGRSAVIQCKNATAFSSKCYQRKN